MDKTLYIYKASAGSGKTFTLAVEYIKLLIANPKAYRHTLAVTFTNKATGEMKERILGSLYGVANALEEAHDYFLKISAAFPTMSEQELRARAREALHLMLHDYGHFRIQTIDAFFQSILRGLAKELELSGDLEILIEDDELLSNTVDLLIKRLTPTSQETAWLVEYVEEYLENDRGWNVRHAIKEFSRNILKEEYQQKGDNLRKQIYENNGALLTEYRNTLAAIEREIKEKAKSIADRFFAIANANGATVEDFTYKDKGAWGFFTKLQQGNPIELGSRMSDYKNNPPKISKKLAADQCQQIAELLAQSEALYDNENVRLTSARLSLARFHQLRLLNSIADTLRDENNRENRFLLAQTTYLLSRMIDNDTSFIFEKIGTEINHIFIDEFQDTSRLQWVCFKVLLEEVMSRGGFNLIVGDVKQAIYRWRNSDWNILNNMNSEFKNIDTGDYLTERMMERRTTNYRSMHNIVRFNNALFKQAATMVAATYSEQLGSRIDDLTRAYSDVEQQLSPHKPDCGYAELRLIDAENKEELTETVGKELIETLRTLIEEKGVRPGDITILVRTHSVIEPIVEAFNRELPMYNIVSDSAYKLSSSLALHTLIAAMRNVLAPHDRINSIELVTLYNKIVKQRTIDNDTLLGLADNYDTLLPATFIEQRELLAQRPINELIEQLLVLFELGTIEGEEAYIYSFLDHTNEYLQSGSCNISDFIEAWDNELGQKTIPAGEGDSVRIVTIHKSKGLEFHTVIIPYASWPIINTRGDILWCHPQEAPFDSLDLLPINYSSAMLQSIYADAYNNEVLFKLVDNLNILYVAFTRAKANLIVFANAKAKADDTGHLLASLIRGEWLDGTVYNSDTRQLTYGTIVGSKSKETDRKKEKKQENPFTTTSTPRLQPFVSYDNRLTSRQSNNLARFLATDPESLEDTDYMDKGELLHEIMSHLITGKELDKELAKKQLEGIIATDSDRARIKKLLERALSHPTAAPWFDGSYTVINECSILYREGTQKVCRPDRVMISGDQAIVVDFKFGKELPAHITQVQMYMRNLAFMGYRNVKGYLWYVYKNSIVPVK